MFWLAEINCGGVSMKLESHISENVVVDFTCAR